MTNFLTVCTTGDRIQADRIQALETLHSEYIATAIRAAIKLMIVHEGDDWMEWPIYEAVDAVCDYIQPAIAMDIDASNNWDVASAEAQRQLQIIFNEEA